MGIGGLSTLDTKETYQTTVVSDADGYQESFPQDSDETVHVDTTATADATADVTPWPARWSGHYQENESRSPGDRLYLFRAPTDDNRSFSFDLQIWNHGSGYIEVWADGTELGRWWPGDGPKSYSGTVSDWIYAWNGTSADPTVEWEYSITFDQSKSAQIENKSVQTDDIHF